VVSVSSHPETLKEKSNEKRVWNPYPIDYSEKGNEEGLKHEEILVMNDVARKKLLSEKPAKGSWK